MRKRLLLFSFVLLIVSISACVNGKDSLPVPSPEVTAAESTVPVETLEPSSIPRVTETPGPLELPAFPDMKENLDDTSADAPTTEQTDTPDEDPISDLQYPPTITPTPAPSPTPAPESDSEFLQGGIYGGGIIELPEMPA